MRLKALLLSACLAAPLSAVAQDDQSLADIRQELTVLYGDIQDLRGELNTTGAPQSPVSGNSALERLNSLEQEVQRLTAQTEELQYRINQVTQDGTNRIGDLEFRLCELESDCDISSLGDTPTLGGSQAAAGIPEPAPAPESSGPSMAVGEQEAFQSAEAALDNGDYRAAAEQFAEFLETYPGGPMSSEAHYLRGEAFESLGETNNAARAYLEAFSSAPEGEQAPEALFKLGASLGRLGQTQDACVTLTEVGTRFPDSQSASNAASERQSLGCS